MNKPFTTRYTVRLFNPGCDMPVAVYNNVQSYQTSNEGITFTRQTGQKTTSNMKYEVTEE